MRKSILLKAALVLTTIFSMLLFSVVGNAENFTSNPVSLPVGESNYIEIPSGTITSMTSSDPTKVEILDYLGTKGGVKALAVGSSVITMNVTNADGTTDVYTGTINAVEAGSTDNTTINISLTVGQTYSTQAYVSVEGFQFDPTTPTIATAAITSDNKLTITATAAGTVKVLYGARTEANGTVVTYTINLTITDSGTTPTPTPTITPTPTPTPTVLYYSPLPTYSPPATTTGKGIELGGDFANITLSANTAFRLKNLYFDGAPIQADGLKWLSSDPTIFTVDANTGIFKPVSQGTALLISVDKTAKFMESVIINVKP